MKSSSKFTITRNTRHQQPTQYQHTLTLILDLLNVHRRFQLFYGFESAIPKVRYSESLLFPLTLSLTLRLTLTLTLIQTLALWCISAQWTFGIANLRNSRPSEQQAGTILQAYLFVLIKSVHSTYIKKLQKAGWTERQDQ